ncbi:RidA family protein [Luteibacter sp. CQ10]|uniref:RidA family protein n=1 Tax=Luteibacter sp. CQ10 TaxID=2805821 RepID=UPI0034A2CF33
MIERLNALGIVLPPPLAALGSYRVVSVDGDTAYVSGLGPFIDGKPVKGRVSAELSLAEGYDAARLTMLMILSCLHDAVGLDRVERCTRLTVYVRAIDGFTQHPAIADGASDLLRDVFGADRLPARSALGVHTLPMGIPVEIDSVFRLSPRA